MLSISQEPLLRPPSVESQSMQYDADSQLRYDNTAVYPQQRPQCRADIEIAIVCALPLEYDALSLLIDAYWDECGQTVGKAVGDRNTYTIGRIGKHNVVVALLPGMGKVNAASAAAGLRVSFPSIRVALLTGICGGAPKTQRGDEILLGDVIIANDVIQYDFGRRYPDHFATREAHSDRLSRPNSEIRGILATLSTQFGIERLQQRSYSFLLGIQEEAIRRNRRPYKYPGATEDKLFVSSYRHRHYGLFDCCCSQWRQSSSPVCERALSSLCTDTACSNAALVPRQRIEARRIEENNETKDTPTPAIFIGRVASGDTVMKSGEDRDIIIQKTHVIAFEMEGAGLCDEIPCLVVKGVCDYADSHKNKGWQDYAAATAAAVTKAVLESFTPTDRQSQTRFIPGVCPEVGIPPPNSCMLSNRHEGEWKSFLLRLALKSVPETLQTCLFSRADKNTLLTQWGATMTEAIISFPEVPLDLSNTLPFNQFVSGVERCIWYQVQECDADVDDESYLCMEYEEIPLTLLRALETDDERRKNLYRSKRLKLRRLVEKNELTKSSKASREGIPDRLSRKHVRQNGNTLLCYVASEITPEDEDLSPFEAFLWSFISQLLLWQPKGMNQLPEWTKVHEYDAPSFKRAPGPGQLQKFLRLLLKQHSTPIVIAIFQAQWLTQYAHTQSVKFLSELYQGSAIASVQVIASAAKDSPILPLFSPTQILSRDTERHECLNELAFEGQFLRRDEVAAADKGTNDWIWSNPAFCSWHRRSSGILWIEGKAGSGKSVLAKTIRSKLSQLGGLALQGVPLPPISDWFFSTRHGSVNKSHVAFLRSILSQILEQNRHAFHHYAAVYRKKKEDHCEWNFEDYENILKELAANSLPAFCIVDAMDESEDSDGTYDLRGRIISLIADICCAQGSRIRFIVLSRYTADIDRALHKYSKNAMLSRIRLEKENVGDITTLVDSAINNITSAMSIYESEEDESDMNYSRYPVDMTQNESEVMGRMREYLVENAEGVILWVVLATQALIWKIRGGFYSLELLESELKALPRGLVDFYKLILKDLESHYSPHELKRTRIALMWVVGANSIRPLVLNELFEALCIPPQPVIQSNVDPIAHSSLRIHAKSWLAFYRQLRVRCGPFLEVIIPENRDSGLNFREDTEISPHFTVQLLHRTVKDFLHDKNESGALGFTQVEAENLVRKSMQTYLELVLPKSSTTYCPVPTAGNESLDVTVRGMANYLEKKYLLEFVLTALPEDETLPHLMIFETSVHPPLMEQLNHWPWDRALKTVSSKYFEYVCQEGLTEAMNNLLSISSNLLVSWPALLRYGPLAAALQDCCRQFSTTLYNDSHTSSRLKIAEAIELMSQFSRHEQDLTWECHGVHSDDPPLIPSIKTLRNAVKEVQINYGKRLGPMRAASREPSTPFSKTSNRKRRQRQKHLIHLLSHESSSTDSEYETNEVTRISRGSDLHRGLIPNTETGQTPEIGVVIEGSLF